MLEDKCGLEGYGFYFKMLELVAEKIDETDSCEVTYSLTRWGRQANITSKKWLYLSSCCADVGLMIVCRDSDNITVKIPNLLNYRDNHTKNLQATCKQDKEEYKEDKDKEKDKSFSLKNSCAERTDSTTENEKKSSPIKSDALGASRKKSGGTDRNNGFDEFWNSYPKKKAKDKAYSAWLKLNPDEQLRQRIIAAVTLATTQDAQWQKEAGEFIPYPASYLNGKRWDDEITQTNSQRISPYVSTKKQDFDKKYGEYVPSGLYPDSADLNSIDSTATRIS